MPFTFRQRNSAGFGANTTCSLALASDPTPGDIICVAMIFSAAISNLVIKDANNNGYVVTSNSPQQASSQFIHTAYCIAPSNANKTLTATWTTSTGSSMLIDNFSVSGGIAAFVNGFKSSGSGTTINSPTVLPAGSNELAWAIGLGTGALSAPTSGATAGVWTGSSFSSDNITEYVLNIGSAQAVSFTNDNSSWGSMALAFSVIAQNYRLGIFSKDVVLAVGAFDMGIPTAYGLYDDDFVAQFSGTTVGATVSGIASVPPGVFSKDATLDGAFDD